MKLIETLIKDKAKENTLQFSTMLEAKANKEDIEEQMRSKAN